MSKIVKTCVARGVAPIGDALWTVSGPKPWTKDGLPVYVAETRVPLWKAEDISPAELETAFVLQEGKS